MNLRKIYIKIMSLFKHMCAKFENNPREEICVTYTQIWDTLKNAVRSRSFEVVRNKNGCILSSTGNVKL